MKDEELAEQNAGNISGLDISITLMVAKNKTDAYRLGRYDGFLAGLKAGRPQWHDLRKDKNDLPKGKRNVWCDYGDDCGKGFYDKDDGGWWIEGHIYCSIIDAWCEIPTFEKEKDIYSEMFPEITLPKGSAELVDKVIADAEKRLKESE